MSALDKEIDNEVLLNEAVEIFKDIAIRDYVGSNHERMRDLVKKITGEDIGDY